MNEQIYKTIEYLKNKPSVEEAENMIRNTFSELPVQMNHINQAYYQYNEDTVFVEKSNGISFTIGKGLGDIWGNNHSNEGVNITASFLDKEYPLYEGNEINILEINRFESEISKNVIEDEFLDETISYFQNANINPLLLMTFDQSIKNDPKLIQTCLETLWRQASAIHLQQVSDASVSPVDGYDVKQLSVEENYLNLLDRFYDEKIKLQGYQYLLSQEGAKEFLEKTKSDLKSQIQFVENKDAYVKINDLIMEKESVIESIYLEYGSEDIKSEIVKLNDQANDNLKQSEVLTKQINELENKINNFENRKFSIWERLTRVPSQELKSMNDALENLTFDKASALADYEEKELESNKLQNDLNKIESIDNEIDKIKFENNIKNDFSVSYVDGIASENMFGLNRVDEFEYVMNYYEKKLTINKEELSKVEKIIDVPENYDHITKVDMKTNMSWYSSDFDGIKDNLSSLNDAIGSYYQTHHKIPDVAVTLSLNGHNIVSEQVVNKDVLMKQIQNKNINVLEALKQTPGLESSLSEQLIQLEEQLNMSETISMQQGLSLGM